MSTEEQTAIGQVTLNTGEAPGIDDVQASLLFAVLKGLRITTGRNSRGAAVSWPSLFRAEHPIGWSHLVSRGGRWGGVPHPDDNWFTLKGEKEGLSELSNRMDHLLEAIGEGWPVFIYRTPEATGVITWERRSHGNRPAITINPRMEVSSWYNLPDWLKGGMSRTPETRPGTLAEALDSVRWEDTTPERGPDETPAPEREEQFIFTFTDRDTRNEFLDLAEENDVPAHWIALSPKEEYENEREFAYEAMFEDLAWTVLRTIEEDLGNDVDEGKDRSGEDRYAWPDLGFREWAQEDRRELVRLAVVRWNHIGPNGADPESILRDHRDGLIPHSRAAG